jgi:hypothetical protein
MRVMILKKILGIKVTLKNKIKPQKTEAFVIV